MLWIARIGLKIPKLSYDQVPQSNHRHYLTRVASYKGNLFALGDYDDEHNYAEIYDPLREVFKWIVSWKSTKLPSGRLENFLKSELDRGRRLSLLSRVSSFRPDVSLFELMFWTGQNLTVRWSVSDMLIVVIVKFVKVCINFYGRLSFRCWWRIIQARIPNYYSHSKI